MKTLPSILAVCFLAGSVHAVSLVRTSRFDLAEGMILPSETWIAAVNAEVRGSADKDFFLAGFSNVVHGTFRSDAWIAGSSTEIDGSVEDDLRLVGDNILTRAQVQGNLLALGRVVQVGQATKVGGDTLIAGTEVLVKGTHFGDVTAAGTSVTLGGDYAGDVRVIARDLVLLRDLNIQGTLRYSANNEVFLDEGIQVTGGLEKLPATSQVLPSFSLAQALYLQSAFFLAAIFCGMPFVGFFPRYTGMCVALVRTQPWKCLITGSVMILLMPIIGFISLGTVVGIPLGVITLALLAIGVYLSKFVIALALGSILFRRSGYQSFISVISVLWGGLLFLYLLDLLPMVGDMIWIGTAVYGLGAMTMASFSGSRLPRTQARPPASNPFNPS